MRANSQHAQIPLHSLGQAIGASRVLRQLLQPWDKDQLGQQQQSKHHLTMQLPRTLQLTRTLQ
jgi:hypothetical protein